MRRLGSILGAFLAFSAHGNLVHVCQQTEAGGVTNQISDTVLHAGMPWETQSAPTVNGYIFTHWTVSTEQDFAARDEWGRAYDASTFMLYEDTTLTAHYLSAIQDADNDGIADGYEIYWYGSLVETPESDTDHDGFTFVQELANGTNPLMADVDIEGPTKYADGTLLSYNPYNYQPFIMRSEPEGVLFATVSNYVRAGRSVSSATGDSVNDVFAYWTVNGVAQRDEWGRALDSLTVQMPTNSVELIAYVVSNANDRASLYWYGDTSVSMDSDTDSDGFTFAAELLAGTNPLMVDEDIEGSIKYADGMLLLCNPYNYQPFIMRSEPEGVLFATVSNHVRAGWSVSSETGDSANDVFAYWTVNGVAQRDEWGRALDSLRFQMPTNAVELVANVVSNVNDRASLYWYGNATTAMESDTDGDGFTFAEELAAGTNPLMEDISITGGIAWADGELHEVNLQPYEQGRGTIVDGGYSELFTSPTAGNGGTSRTFDGAATPTIVDLNGDGRFDLVVETANGTRTVFINNGGEGNPRFVEMSWDAKWYDALAAAKTNTIDGLTFDTPPVDAVSWSFADVDGDGTTDLLVADSEGRIWYYKGDGGALGTTRPTNYVLQHKVWGGSFAGFAQGLKIAAVDWDDDGDVDLVCGTADGKLMLLNDPRIGRPTGLRADAGATSVVLSWDASVNSRVRGYGVYRGVDAENYERIEALCPLPRYRDMPPTLSDKWYRVTAKSRFYVTGNSEPIESETEPSAAVRVSFGEVDIWLNDTSSFTETNVSVIVSIKNSMGLAAKGLAMTFAYDAGVLEPVEIKRTGLTAGLAFTEGTSGGTWRMTGTGGEIGIGAGRFLELVFRVKPVHDVTETTVTLTAATVRTTEGQGVSVDLPKSAKIEISDANPLQPALVSLSVGNAAVDTGEAFELPFTVTSTEVLTSGVFTVAYDSAMLEWRGEEGTKVTEGTKRTVTVRATESGTLPFMAKDQHSVVTNFSTTVEIGSFAAVDCNGFEVVADGTQGMVLIKNAHPILPAVVGVSTEDRKVDTLEEVVVPFKITSTQPIASGSFTVEWDAVALERVGGPQGNGSATISATGDLTLTFLAKDQHDITSSQVRLTAATVTDVNGFTVYPTVPVVSTVIIHDAHPLMPAEVAVKAGTVSADTRATFDLPVMVTSSKPLTNFCVTVGWDNTVLELRGATGAELRRVVDNAPYQTGEGSACRVVGGGGGFTLTFYAKDQHAVTDTAVTLSDGSAFCSDGLAANITLANGRVLLTDSNPPVPAKVVIGISDVKAKSGEAFVVPLSITADSELSNVTVTVAWDASLLSFAGAEGSSACSVAGTSATLTFPMGGSTRNVFNIGFSAAEILTLNASAAMSVTAASGTSANGLAAEIVTVLPIAVNVLISREIGRYSPGDVDGDGQLTDADGMKITKYIAYLENRWYFDHYGLAHQYNLVGDALNAADVNRDGRVDYNDVALLQTWLNELAGGAQ